MLGLAAQEDDEEEDDDDRQADEENEEEDGQMELRTQAVETILMTCARMDLAPKITLTCYEVDGQQIHDLLSNQKMPEKDHEIRLVGGLKILNLENKVRRFLVYILSFFIYSNDSLM